MNLVLLALVLQSSLVLPPRTGMENPAAVSLIPRKLQKNYDKLWKRFIGGTDDAKLRKDLDSLLRKEKTFDPALVIEGYLALYKSDNTAAQARFSDALKVNPNNRIAVYYLAEVAFARAEYTQAATLYGQLLSMPVSLPDIDTKRQRATLLAMDTLLNRAVTAERENRFSEAEDRYRQALKIAPNEPALHTRLADVLLKQNKTEEAEAERKAAEALVPALAAKPTEAEAESAKVDDLEDLGRWGSDIDVFHRIRDAEAATREQVALLIVRYFPQVTEFRQTPRIVTDIENSLAKSEIQMVVAVGLMDPLPNHAFEPAAPVTRGDLASTLARLSRMIGISDSPTSPIVPSDLAPTNAMYPDIQLVLASGLLTVGDSGSFDVSGRVSGPQAVRAAERLLHTFQQVQR
jgi:tetratricopeptide (TPR) repeat protein